MNQLAIKTLPGEYAICRLNPLSEIPSFAWSSAFCSVTRSADEISIICEAALVPEGITCTRGWALLQIASVLDLSLTGITARFSTALAGAGINLCVVATYDTDYLLVPAEKRETALAALQAADFIIQ